ncbi:MAG TPA: hypothetical protein VFO41_05800 [Alphaproteobacteria bacterium]|nr:hypothetical protein [Alphaproteobacteria bacterium]
MDRLLTRAADIPETVTGWADAAGVSAAVASMGTGLAAAWGWWAGLIDAYVWTDIGAFVAPILAVTVVAMFWAITRLHLQG